MARIPRAYPARYEGERHVVRLSDETLERASQAGSRANSKDRFELTSTLKETVEKIIDEYVTRTHSRSSWVSHHDVRDLLQILANAIIVADVERALANARLRSHVLRSLRLAGVGQELDAVLRRSDGPQSLTVDEIQRIASTAVIAIDRQKRAFGKPGRSKTLAELLPTIHGLAAVYGAAGGKIAADRSPKRRPELDDDEALEISGWSPFVRWAWTLLHDPSIPPDLRPESARSFGKQIADNLRTIRTTPLAFFE